MFTALFFPNPFEPHTHILHEGEAGISFGDWMRKLHGPAFAYFDRPTLILYNRDRALLFEEWETTILQDGDELRITTIPGYEAIIYIVVAIVAAVAAYALTPTPEVPGQTAGPDPTYSIKGQTNQLKVMQPIEVVYGRCRIYPSYAARPFNTYASNQQYQYNLFCLGQGEFDVDGVYIEDTPIDNFQEAEFAIYGPNEVVELFPDNVITSVEVGSIQLFGPNGGDDYPGPDGWFGGFIANDSGTQAYRLEIDVTFPAGLGATYEGNVINQTVQLEFQKRLVNNAGAPLGGWGDFGDGVYTFVENDTSAQRFTLGEDVTPGRYELRGRRITNENPDTAVFKDSYWEGLRAFLPSTKVYGNVTMLAVKIKATNNLNDNTRSRINLWATRKLQVWDSDLNDGDGGWTAETQATRSIVWALCDAFRAQYGARLADEFLDMPGLLAAHAFYEVKERYFDWIFDQRITVWEAAKAICRCGRAVPMLFGSLVGLVRDRPKTIPSAIFTPDSMVAGSFSLTRTMWEPDAIDHVIIEYVDPENWRQQTVTCTLPGLPVDNGDNIKLSGCTSRDWAWREGMYILAGKVKWRQSVKFRTGLEGNIPNYGDLIQVSHDVPRWGQPGTVEEFAVIGYWLCAIPGPLPGYKYFQVDTFNGKPRISTTGEAEAPEVGTWGVIYWAAGSWITETWEDGLLDDGFTVVSAAASPEDVAAFGLIEESGDFAYLGRAVSFVDGIGFYIMFQTKIGGATVAMPVIAGPQADIVQVTFPEDFDFGDFAFDVNSNPVLFYIGISNFQQGLFQVTGLAPSDDDTVEFSATNYAPEVFAYDEEDPPALPSNEPLPPPIENLPSVTGLMIRAKKPQNGIVRVTATWKPSPGAKYYVVEQSRNGTKWGQTRQFTDTQASFQFQFAQTLYIRVAAVNTAAGPFTSVSFSVTTATNPPAAPSGLELESPWTGLSFTVLWQPGADSFLYRARIKDASGVTTYHEADVDGTEFEYTNAMAVIDGAVHRDYKVEIVSANSAGESSATVLDVSNPLPVAPTGLNSSLDSGSTYNCVWTHASPADFKEYKVYANPVSGFTPGPGDLVYTGTAHGCQITTGGVPTYWVVSASDKWGAEEVLSAEDLIP